MNWSGHLWNQIKNKTSDELISALQKDNWLEDITRGATRVFIKDKRRVVIHPHPKKTYRSPKLLKDLIDDIGWDEDDLRKLKLIK